MPRRENGQCRPAEPRHDRQTQFVDEACLEKLSSESWTTLGDDASHTEPTQLGDNLSGVDALVPGEHVHLRARQVPFRSSCTALGREDEHGVIFSIGVSGRRKSMTVNVTARRHDRERGALRSQIALPPHRLSTDQHDVRQFANDAENGAIGARRERLRGAIGAGSAAIERRDEVEPEVVERVRVIPCEQGQAGIRIIEIDEPIAPRNNTSKGRAGGASASSHAAQASVRRRSVRR